MIFVHVIKSCSAAVVHLRVGFSAASGQLREFAANRLARCGIPGHRVFTGEVPPRIGTREAFERKLFDVLTDVRTWAPT